MLLPERKARGPHTGITPLQSMCHTKDGGIILQARKMEHNQNYTCAIYWQESNEANFFLPGIYISFISLGASKRRWLKPVS